MGYAVPYSDGPHNKGGGDKNKVHELAAQETEPDYGQQAQCNPGEETVHRANSAGHSPHLVNIYRSAYSGHVTVLYAIPP